MLHQRTRQTWALASWSIYSSRQINNPLYKSYGPYKINKIVTREKRKWKQSNVMETRIIEQYPRAHTPTTHRLHTSDPLLCIGPQTGPTHWRANVFSRPSHVITLKQPPLLLQTNNHTRNSFPAPLPHAPLITYVPIYQSHSPPHVLSSSQLPYFTAHHALPRVDKPTQSPP